jgi:hypothetical protein
MAKEALRDGGGAALHRQLSVETLLAGGIAACTT